MPNTAIIWKAAFSVRLRLLIPSLVFLVFFIFIFLNQLLTSVKMIACMSDQYHRDHNCRPDPACSVAAASSRFSGHGPVDCTTWSSVLQVQYNVSRWLWGAGIAQWLEHRTRDWKVAGSNPCWNGGRIFFSRVDFLCWLLFRYPFHPRVTTVARKKSRSFCQKCRWQVTAKHAYTLRMWILLNRASALVTTCP